MGRPHRPGVCHTAARFGPLLCGVLLGLLLMHLLPSDFSSVEVVDIAQQPSSLSPRAASSSRGVTLLLPPRGGHLAALEPVLAMVKQLRAASPATPIAVVASEDSLPLTPDAVALVDRVVALSVRAARDWGGPIAALLASPWQRTLFLAAGVQACQPLDEMFDWLDRYDMGLVLNPLPLRQSLLAVAPSNVGWHWPAMNDYRPDVMLFDRNPRVVAFLNAWNDFLLDPHQPSDTSFAEALQRSDLRVKSLPVEFNLVMPPSSLPVYLTGAVRLLNTREETCERVNRLLLPRLYDAQQGRALYSWRLAPDTPEKSALLSDCEADEGHAQANSRVHRPVVPDQLDVPA